LNIIEAIKSKKRFKRSEYNVWFEVSSSYHLRRDELMCDDWVTEEPKVEVTATMVRVAVAKLHGQLIGNPEDTANFIIKELGL
jgi:hypothetical protein